MVPTPGSAESENLGYAMSTAQQCRAQADLCRKLARTVSEVWVAVTLDEMASEYTGRAEELELQGGDEGSTRDWRTHKPAD